MLRVVVVVVVVFDAFLAAFIFSRNNDPRVIFGRMHRLIKTQIGHARDFT